VKEWRFALSRKWVGYFAVAVVFAIVCAFLANWQWQRRAENLALLDRLNANYSAEPAALTSILPELSSYSDADHYRPVTITGTYLVDKTCRRRPETSSSSTADGSPPATGRTPPTRSPLRPAGP
jgi:cytochrome oxidase assembly protein ShyY1